MDRPITTLFMLMSVDGKISTGSSDERDVDRDFPKIPGVREGLHQYYEIEQTTDLWSFNTGRVQAKIIANQNPGAKDRLDAWGLGRYFSVIASSAELGISKPDKEIFRLALAMADCRPENAVMVGDRLDNDIRPAKELGMKTVRIRKGLAIYMKPSCETEVPDFTVDSLSEILSIPCLIEEWL